MKYILLFILPSLVWANCEGLKEAVEQCRPFECELPSPVPEMKSTIKILGPENDTCVVESSSPTPKGKGELGQICRYKKSSLPIAAEINWVPIEMANMLTKLSSEGSTKSTNSLPDLASMQAKMEAIQKRMEELNPKLFAEHNGKNPCSPKDVATSAKFTEAALELSEAFKPLASSVQQISKEKSNELFPDGQPGCVISTQLQNLDNAQKIPNIKGQEDCKKLALSNCSSLLKETSLKKLACPVEIYLLWVNPKGVAGENKASVLANLMSSKVCEINGLVRADKKVTFDSEFKKNSARYCRQPKGYTCKVRLLTKDTTVELDSSSEVIPEREGAEVKCLKLAKKLARPHCERPNQPLYGEVLLTVEDRLDPTGILVMKTFENFCQTYRLKKVFH